MISVTHSCGDCGFLGQEPDFDRHHRRAWHRLVMEVGLEMALTSSVTCTFPDAQRAVAMFRRVPESEERTAATCKRFRHDEHCDHD